MTSRNTVSPNTSINVKYRQQILTENIDLNQHLPNISKSLSRPVTPPNNLGSIEKDLTASLSKMEVSVSNAKPPAATTKSKKRDKHESNADVFGLIPSPSNNPEKKRPKMIKQYFGHDLAANSSTSATAIKPLRLKVATLAKKTKTVEVVEKIERKQINTEDVISAVTIASDSDSDDWESSDNKADFDNEELDSNNGEPKFDNDEPEYKTGRTLADINNDIPVKNKGGCPRDKVLDKITKSISPPGTPASRL